MKWRIDTLTYSAMKGFGLGVILAVLFTVSTSQPSPVTTIIVLTNPFVLLFTLLGLGLGFEETVQ